MLPTLGLQKPIVWTRVSYQAVVRCFGYISCHTQTYTCANFVSPFLLLASTHKSDCHPIEDVSAVLDELCTITDCKMLGEELQVPHQVLHNIDSNNTKAERKIVATIHTWFNITEKPCWEMVVRALKRMLPKKPAWIAGRLGVNYNEATFHFVPQMIVHQLLAKRSCSG